MYPNQIQISNSRLFISCDSSLSMWDWDTSNECYEYTSTRNEKRHSEQILKPRWNAWAVHFSMALRHTAAAISKLIQTWSVCRYISSYGRWLKKPHFGTWCHIFGHKSCKPLIVIHRTLVTWIIKKRLRFACARAMVLPCGNVCPSGWTNQRLWSAETSRPRQFWSSAPWPYALVLLLVIGLVE